MQFLQTHVLQGKLAPWQVTDTQSRTVIRNNRKIKLKQRRKKGRYGISKHQKKKKKKKENEKNIGLFFMLSHYQETQLLQINTKRIKGI